MRTSHNLRARELPEPRLSVSNRKGDLCLEHFLAKVFFLFIFAALDPLLTAQTAIHPVRADLPAQDEIIYGAVVQDSQSEWKYLKGSAKVETTEMMITADENRLQFRQCLGLRAGSRADAALCDGRHHQRRSRRIQHSDGRGQSSIRWMAQRLRRL